MSPFLAQVNVFNLADAALSSAPPSQLTDSTDLRATLRYIKENAREVAAVTKKAREEAAQIKEDNDDGDKDEDVTINNGTKSIVVHHSKSKGSSDGDMAVAAVPIVAIVFVFLWLIVKALMAPFTQKAARRGQAPTGQTEGLSEEEQAVLLKLQRVIGDMERRIESLETILVDEHRTKEKYGTKI